MRAPTIPSSVPTGQPSGAVCQSGQAYPYCLVSADEQTDRLSLVKLGPEHMDAFCTIMGAPGVRRWVAGLPEGRDDLAYWARFYLFRLSRQEADFGRLMVERETGREVGLLVMSRLQESGERWMLSYAVHPDHWGRGYAPEAVGATLARMAEYLPHSEIVASTEPGNDASERVLEKLGFVDDGIRPYLGRSVSGATEGPAFVLKTADLVRGHPVSLTPA